MKKRLWIRKKERRSPIGGSPGVLIADPQAESARIHLMSFSQDSFEEKELTSLSDIPSALERFPVTWLNVDGLKDVNMIGEIGNLFGLHRLALEDVVNGHQRAKVEEYDDHLFIVAQMVWQTDDHVWIEQLSLFLGRHFLVSFQERPGDCLDAVRARIRTGQGRIRKSGPDYLCYAIMDAVVDGFFPVLETYGHLLEEAEQTIIKHHDPLVVTEIHRVRHELLFLRRSMWPQREAILQLFRHESALIDKDAHVYWRDCYDHAIRIMDLIDSYREIGSDLMSLHISGLSHRLGEVMRVLTMIATIFIPMSFVAAVYGMNFDREVSPFNMPELEWYFGYPLCLLLMLGIALVQLYFFRKKGWIGNRMGARRKVVPNIQESSTLRSTE